MVVSENDDSTAESVRLLGALVGYAARTVGKIMDELVTVFETNDPGLIAIVKSLLDDASIDYLAKGEHANNLYGVNMITGPVKFQVREEDAEQARELLTELSK